MSGDMSLQAGDGISLTTADSPKPSRTLDVLSHAIPFFGPFLALKTSVSYKAITDALQLYGIIDGLLLSIAFGALGGGQPSDSALSSTCPHVSFMGCTLDVMFFATCILMLEMLHVFTTIYTLSVVIDADGELQDKQIRIWWQWHGRLNMLLHIVLLLLGISAFWYAVAHNLMAKYSYFQSGSTFINVFMWVFIALAIYTNASVMHSKKLAGRNAT